MACLKQGGAGKAYLLVLSLQLFGEELDLRVGIKLSYRSPNLNRLPLLLVTADQPGAGECIPSGGGYVSTGS